ncbi:DUF815 domain-containing protein, partial [Acidithiobacillus ferrooxidans]
MERQQVIQGLAALLGDSSSHPLPDFAGVKAARWRHLPLGGRLEGVARVDLPEMDELLGIEDTKAALDLNTRQFVAGFPANDALLWGGRG